MDEYKEIERYRAHYYTNTPLYYRSGDSYVLYKKEGESINMDKVDVDEIPKYLFIKKQDLRNSTEELFDTLIDNLQSNIENNKEEVSSVIEEIVENMFLNLDSDSMSFAPTIIKKVTTRYLNEPNLLKEFLSHVKSNDDLTYHSIRVLLFTLTYCYNNRMSLDEIQKFGLTGLFHNRENKA